MSPSAPLAQAYRKYGALIYSRCRRQVNEADVEKVTVDVFTQVAPRLCIAKDERTAVACIEDALARYFEGQPAWYGGEPCRSPSRA
jgi:hypothetical protein